MNETFRSTSHARRVRRKSDLNLVSTNPKSTNDPLTKMSESKILLTFTWHVFLHMKFIKELDRDPLLQKDSVAEWLSSTWYPFKYRRTNTQSIAKKTANLTFDDINQLGDCIFRIPWMVIRQTKWILQRYNRFWCASRHYTTALEHIVSL